MQSFETVQDILRMGKLRNIDGRADLETWDHDWAIEVKAAVSTVASLWSQGMTGDFKTC